jgi:hypothetical protein
VVVSQYICDSRPYIDIVSESSCSLETFDVSSALSNERH